MVQEGFRLVSQDAGWAKGINRSPCRAGLGVGHPDYSGGLVAVQWRGPPKQGLRELLQSVGARHAI